ncbi:calcium-binding protein [Methylolobus aquaticus]
MTTIPGNVTTSGDAFYTEVGDTLIQGGALVSSTTGYAIHLAGTGQTYDLTTNGVLSGGSAALGLWGEGNIYAIHLVAGVLSGGAFGVLGQQLPTNYSGSVDITVGTTTVVSASVAGMQFQNLLDVRIANAGRIIASGERFFINRTGLVLVGSAAPTGPGAYHREVINSGLIYGDDVGIQVGGPGTSVIENSGAIISGDTVGGIAIRSGNITVDNVTNSGRLIGDVSLGGMDDVLTNQSGGRIFGDVSMGDGDDQMTQNGLVFGQIDLGAGNDIFVGGSGEDSVDGGTGDDQMAGGGGNDSYIVDSSSDRIVERSGEGFDTISTSVSYRLARSNNNIEVLQTNDPTATTAINLTGNALSQELIGNAGDNRLSGGGGNDILTGGLGKDVLVGGLGQDVFAYEQVLDSGLTFKFDRILDFKAGTDKIDLSAIDANEATAGIDDAFTLVRVPVNTGSVEVGTIGWYQQDRANDARDTTYLIILTEEGLGANMVIQLTGLVDLTTNDFYL